MPRSLVQRVLLKICEERKEVSGGLSDFITSDRAHRWRGAAEGRDGHPWRWVMHRPLEPPILNPDVLICWDLAQNPDSQYGTKRRLLSH